MQQQRRPLVIGHRGAPGYRPEHTVSAYRIALEQGVDAVEPDIVPTRDGVLVVRHENEISGTTDIADHSDLRSLKTTKIVDGVTRHGWFTEDLTWEQIRQLRARERLRHVRKRNRKYDGADKLLRLAEVLQLIDRHGSVTGHAADVVIEIKHAAYVSALGFDWGELIARELALAGWTERGDRIVFECFELTVLEELQRRGFAGTFVFLLESKGEPADEVLAAEQTGGFAQPFSWYRSNAGLDALRGRVDGISVAKRDLFDEGVLGVARGTNDLVDRAHQRGLLVFTWTLRPENLFLNQRFRLGAKPASWGDWEGEFGLIIRTGVDGIFVDHPDLGVSAVRSTLEAT